MSTPRKVAVLALAISNVLAVLLLVRVSTQNAPPYAASAYHSSDGSYRVGWIPDDGTAPTVLAVKAVQHALGYDYRRLDADLKAATALMTQAFAKEFSSTFTQVVSAAATSQKVVSVAVVKDAGLIDRSGDRARCLVFVDQVVVGSAKPLAASNRILQSRVVVSLTRSASGWLVSGILPLA